MAANEDYGVGAGDGVTETLLKAFMVVGIGALSIVLIGYLGEVAVYLRPTSMIFFKVAVWMAALPRNEVGSCLLADFVEI